MLVLGDETMSIPTDVEPAPDNNHELAVPDEATYYQLQGGKSAAQYYVNPPGVPVDRACRWGDPSEPTGNWAPTILNVGWDDGRVWLSIFPNRPTQTSAQLPYTIRLVGNNQSDNCQYKNGQYCSGANYENCNQDQGCTISAPGGGEMVFSLLPADSR
jgi:hypothetical protein